MSNQKANVIELSKVKPARIQTGDGIDQVKIDNEAVHIDGLSLDTSLRVSDKSGILGIAQTFKAMPISGHVGFDGKKYKAMIKISVFGIEVKK